MFIKNKVYGNVIRLMNLVKWLISYGILLVVCLSCTTIPHSPITVTPTSLSTLQLVEKIRLGRGTINDVVVSPNGTTLAVASSLGVGLYDIKTLKELRHLEGHTGSVGHVVWSPDSTQLASASRDGTVRVWDATSGQQVYLLAGHTDWVGEVIWSPDGTRLASSGAKNDNTVRVWDVGTGRQLYILEKFAGTIAWSPDSTKLASVTSGDSILRVWDATNGQQLYALTDYMIASNNPIWSSDSTRLALEAKDNLLVLEAATGRPLQILKGHTDWITDVSWSPDSVMLASASLDKTVRVWDATTGHQMNILEGLSEPVESVAWSPDGTRLALGGWDGRTRIWSLISNSDKELVNKREVHILPGPPNGWKTRVVWSLDGNWLVSFSNSNTFQVWETASELQARVSEGYTFGLESVAWSPDGTRIAAGDKDGGNVRVWVLGSVPGRSNQKMLELVHVLSHGALDIKVAWSPDGSLLASAGREGKLNSRVRVWDATTGDELYKFNISAMACSSIAWSPDGLQLAIGGSDGTIRVWNVKNSQQVHLLNNQTGYIQGVAWSPDNTLLASNNGIVRVWNVASEQKVYDMLGIYTIEVGKVAWSPDGVKLASAGMGNDFKDIVWIWDMVSGRQVQELPNGSLDVAWSPDGTMLASSGTDIWVWNVVNGQQLGTAKAHTDNVVDIDWSPDGTMLASASRDGTVRVWEIRK